MGNRPVVREEALDAGAYVKRIRFYDGNDLEVGEAVLPKALLLGWRDTVTVEFSWEEDGTPMMVRMEVICPECERNPLIDSRHDYVCPACRAKVSCDEG